MSGKTKFTGRRASAAASKSLLAPALTKSGKKAVKKKETEEERLEREGKFLTPSIIFRSMKFAYLFIVHDSIS